MAGALAFAAEVADKRPLPLVRNLKADAPECRRLLRLRAQYRQGDGEEFPGAGQCVDCVEAAVKSPKFDDGMRVERDIFLALMMTPESKALRHAFFGERAASKIPDVPEDTPQRKIEKVAVIGAGTMGGGISMNFLNAGIPVTILEMKQDALDRGIGVMRKNYESQVKRGKLKQDKYEQRMALLKTTLSYDDVKDADLVIEAVFEEMGVKEKVFKTLDEVMKPGAILASNTSTLDVDKIAAFTKRPQDVVGLHFFSPANVMKLLEVVRGAKTAQGRAGHRDDGGQEDQEDRGGLRRVRRLHRQPHDRAVQPPGRLPAGRRLHAGAGGQGDREVRLCDGPVPHGRPGRQRHRLGDPQAPRGREARTCKLQQDGRPAVRDGPLWPEDAGRLVRLRGRQARRHPQPGGGGDDREASRQPRHQAAQDRRRRDRAAPGLRAGQRRREDPRRRHRQQGQRHRHGLPHRLRLPAAPRRADVLRRHGGPVQRGAGDEALCRQPAGRRRFWQPAPLLAKLAAEGKSFG